MAILSKKNDSEATQSRKTAVSSSKKIRTHVAPVLRGCKRRVNTPLSQWLSGAFSGAFTRRLHAAPFFQAKPAERDLNRRPPIWGASALPPPQIEHKMVYFLGYLSINFIFFGKKIL